MTGPQPFSCSTPLTIDHGTAAAAQNPATAELHCTLGLSLGMVFTPVSGLNAALPIAPTRTAVNCQGDAVSHQQTNAQFMYTHRC